MSSFIVEFPLTTEVYQSHILDNRFEMGRKIYNILTSATQKRYGEMVKTKNYKHIKQRLSELYKSTSKTVASERKVLFVELNELYKKFGMSEYAFHADVKEIRKKFAKHIDSSTAQKIATQLWRSYQSVLFGNGERVHYKRFETFNSFEGKTNKTGIRFRHESKTLIWNKLTLPVQIDSKNNYEQEALENDISYCRIVRKHIRNKNKYYLQIVFKGQPPTKYDKETGEIKHSLGKGDVGLDIGTQTLAVSSKNAVNLIELADRIQNIENEKRLISRKLDRSKRVMNPNNFNTDGTIKKQGGKKATWIKSNRYRKNQSKLRELYRKQTAIRKLQHECLANDIISLGDKVYVETMNYKGLQQRAKNIEHNEKGKFKRKKRFGKSIANKAPAMLLEILNRKLKKHGTTLIKIDTWNAKASQFNHTDNSYKKKKLSQRWTTLDDNTAVQRDMYSAFLIMNVNEDDLKSFNLDKCNKRFEKFKQLHDLEIIRLKSNKNLGSMGI